MPATKRKATVADKAPAAKEEAVVEEEVSSSNDSNVVRTLNVEACKSWFVPLRLAFVVSFVTQYFFPSFIAVKTEFTVHLLSINSRLLIIIRRN